jgi:hypothetical protein
MGWVILFIASAMLGLVYFLSTVTNGLAYWSFGKIGH